MKLSRRFPNESEARAFGAGLEEANDGNVHSVNVEKSPEAFWRRVEGLEWSASERLLTMFDWKVTWIDENRKAAELPEKNLPLTPQEYVAHKGAICPVCQGSGLEVNPSSGVFDYESASIKVHCNNPDCEASWTDCYELSGYDNLER